jgi:DNA processing protein
MAADRTVQPTPHPTPLGEDPVDWLRLIRSRRVGPATFHRLVADHGDVRNALAALPDIARAAGVDGYEPCPADVARAELSRGRAAGARLLRHGGPDYPQSLMDLPDAPPLLWCLGDVSWLSRPMVALVGARNASSLGQRMARRLAESLGQAGQVVISGLARGIDAEAHRAALPTGTVAVMAGGVDVLYPSENAGLYADVAAKGCLVSEQPMGCEPQARHFPLRNRIISGLSRAVVVVEAASRSGSLITAKEALDQGREVLAVPGHPFDARAAGCNQLIREGAVLVRSASDVLEALGMAAMPEPGQGVDAPPEPVTMSAPRRSATVLPGPVPARRPLTEIAALHGRILDRLGPSPLAEDQLIRDLAEPASVIAPELVALELEGRIHRAAGGLLSRVS